MSDAPWDRLPHDPRGFFELPEGFDEKALRRSYNRWLRVYKPERSPDEFQRLRAAYEQLADELRYLGAHEEGPPPVVAPSSTAAERAQPLRPGAAAGPDLVQLAATDPAAAFAVLRDRQPLTAIACVRLAVLADVVDVPDRGTFASWLLQGLQLDRRALLHLVHAYAQTQEAHAAAAELLPALAALGDPVVLGYCGERLLHEQLRTRSWAEFARLYGACLSRIGHADHPACRSLRLSVLRAAAFTAPAEWVAAQWAALSRVAEGPVAMGFEEELEFVGMLLDYRDERSAFPEGSPLQRRVDETILALARGGSEADVAFLELQFAIREEQGDLRDEFIQDDREARTALQVLHAHALRATGGLGEVEAGEVLRRAKELVNRIDNLGRRSVPCVLLGLLLTFVCMAPLWGIAVSAGIVASTQPPMWARVAIVIGAGLVGGLVSWWALRHPRGLRQQLQQFVYRRVLRAEVVSFVRRNQLPYDELWSALVAVNAPLQVHSSYVLPKAVGDVALAFVSVAQRLP